MILQFTLAGVLPLLPLVPVLIYFYYKYWHSKFQYWEERGVASIPGKFPHGSSRAFTIPEKFKGYVYEEMCKEFSDQPFFGIYHDVKPILMVHNPESIRLIMTKEFNHFRNRFNFKFDENDILAKHLFLLNGDKWRALRVKLSPIFTSGKLKGMFPLFVKCSKVMEDFLLQKLDNDVQVKVLASWFSADVICSCAFGLEANVINDDKSPFRRFITEDSLQGYVRRTWKDVIAKYFPFIKFEEIVRITPMDLEKFMTQLVRDTVEHREKTGEKRLDFIDLLIQLKNKGNLADAGTDLEGLDVEPILMTPEFMAAQCLVFFTAGQETSSTLKTFALYELAQHQEIQDRLRQEIYNTLEKHGEITYQAVQEMEYLDMVVNETLRKYPTLFQLDRTCSSDFTFPNGARIEKGTHVVIPTWALHHDPEYYPDPEKFDPERFTKEAREARHPFVFLPFGEGPRICIGQRFGLLQSKIGLITFLRKFKIEKSDKTEIPLQLQADHQLSIKPKNPIILRLLKI